jgi:hypothetical protein
VEKETFVMGERDAMFGNIAISARNVGRTSVEGMKM